MVGKPPYPPESHVSEFGIVCFPASAKGWHSRQKLKGVLGGGQEPVSGRGIVFCNKESQFLQIDFCLKGS